MALDEDLEQWGQSQPLFVAAFRFAGVQSSSDLTRISSVPRQITSSEFSTGFDNIKLPICWSSNDKWVNANDT